MPDMKRCRICGKEKERTTDNFYSNKTMPDGLSYECKTCTGEHRREFYQKNKQKIRDRQNTRYNSKHKVYTKIPKPMYPDQARLFMLAGYQPQDINMLGRGDLLHIRMLPDAKRQEVRTC